MERFINILRKMVKVIMRSLLSIGSGFCVVEVLVLMLVRMIVLMEQWWRQTEELIRGVQSQTEKRDAQDGHGWETGEIKDFGLQHNQGSNKTR